MPNPKCLYVATHGRDDNDGSKDRPFLTINRAQRSVRQEIGGGMTADVIVYVHGGRYEIDATLRFDERDSGRDGFRVRYLNVPDEKPVLFGGRAITGWEKHSNTVWKAKVESQYRFQTLYDDGHRVWKARFPEKGYFLTDEAVHTAEAADDEIAGFRFRLGDIPEDIRLESAQAFVWPGEGEWNWFSETKTVLAIDHSKRTLIFESPATWKIGQGSRYYIQGSLAFLRSPGQFHLDEGAQMLYYWPLQGDNFDEGSSLPQRIIAPTVTRLLELRGRDPEHRLQNLDIAGLTLACTDSAREYRMMTDNSEREEHREGLIYVDNASGITITDCTIRNSGTCGIFLDRHSRNVVLSGNEIEYVGYVGVYASGFAPGEGEFKNAEDSYTNKGHAITNNLIRHGGELIGHGCGILLFQSGDNDVSHNLISHMPRYGISMKGLRYGGMPSTLYDVPVTWENHWDFLHTRNNRIAYNDISHVMEDSQDGGMIESWGPGRGNVIHGNRLHHSGIHFSFGFGIYLDDASDDFIVSNNVLDHLYSTGEGKLWMVIFSKGIGNRIRNNLLVDSPQAISAIGTQEMAGEANKHVIVEGNLIANSGEYLYYFVNWDEERFTVADRNLYWRNGEPCRIAGELPLIERKSDSLGRGEYDWTQWLSLLEGKYDGDSRIADPLFLDAGAEDYRLRGESPAYGLGWRDIEFGKIGPQPNGSYSQKS